VLVHQRGALRVTDLGNGKTAYEFADWSRVTWTNPKKHRSYSKLEGGDTVEKQVSPSVIKVRAEGDNWGQGNGIYGIPWSRGNISYTVIKADTPDYEFVDLDLSHARKVVQVCYKIGSKPVRGSNVPAES